MIYQLFTLIFFMIFNFTFSEIHTPEISKEKITIALLDEPFYNLSYPNIPSLNDTAKNFLKDYMQLNVVFKTVSYKDLKNELESGTIDGVALIPKNISHNDDLYFSESIFPEKIYVISQNIPINSLKDLNNKVIYTPYIESYTNTLNTVLENNDLNSFPMSVGNLNDYKKDLILTANPVLYIPNYGVKIGNSSGVAIALSHKYMEIIPSINQALKSGYRDIFLKDLDDLNKAISYDNFYASLTSEEKKYLETLSPIKVAYENRTNSLVSYKSGLDGRYKGIIPNIFKVLKDVLNIDFVDVTDDEPKTTDNLKNNEFDTMVLSKTQKRSKDFIFSKKIHDIGVYVISLDHPTSSSGTLGVLKNNVEEHLARRSDLDSNIIAFDNLDSMTKALNNGEVKSLLVTNKENFDSNKYNITPFESIPVNLVFNKEDKILRDIIDKAFHYSIDLNNLVELSELERDLENKNIYQMDKEIHNILILFSTLFIFITLAVSIYLYRERLNKKNLLKDSLTGLPNRFVFDKFCSKQNSLTGCTFVIDLNNFKDINDSLGHEFGDIVLKEFANFLKNNFTDSYIFRISGDEFYGFSFESSAIIINKLKKFKEFCPTLLKYNITFNLGISYKTPEISLSTSFKYSDLAMLETKKDKNSFFKIADEKFIEKMNREISILFFLKDDIKSIYPVFQPKFCLKTKRIIGAEALARYNSPKFRPILPFEFIPIAEKYNFIHKVDYKIAKESIIFVKELMDNGISLDNFRISFNLSMKTFKRDDLITVISGLLNYYKVPGKYLDIEITESIFILDMKDLVNKLNVLKSLDIQISLDDFTAGHSTAGLLPLLPIDVVKLDKSLLDSFEVNQTKGMIVYRNLISLLKDLNFKIVSEGAETKEQVAFLELLKVDYVQGYYFSKALSKEVLTEDIKNKKKF